MKVRRALGAALAVGVAAIAPSVRAEGAIADPGVPAAPVADVPVTLHGVVVHDPYRWLENAADPRTIAWEQAENAHARAFLDALPVRDRVDARVKRLVGASSPSWQDLRLAGGAVFALVTAPPAQQPMIAILGPAGTARTQRIVVDPNRIDPSGQTAIDWFEPSPDGRLVAVSLSRNGSEDGTVHVFNATNGHETGDLVPRAQFPTAGGSLAWAPDSRGFWVTRYPGADRPEADRHFFQRVVFHRLGTDPATDREVIGTGLPKVAEIALDDRQDPDMLLVSVADGDGGRYEHFAIGPDGVAHRLTRFEDGIVAAAIGRDGTTYLVSRKGSPRGRLLTLAPGVYDLTQARVLVPESHFVMQGGGEFGGEPIVVTDRALYLRELDGGPSRVAIYGHDGTSRGTLPLPDLASVSEVAPVGGGTLFYSVATWLAPPRFLAWDEAAGTGHATTLAETSPVSFADAEVVRSFATSKDGTRIPVNVFRRRGTKLDGRNPTLLYGYGGYGVSLVPEFIGAPARIWLDGGGVYAIANTRGGGEYGEQWHLDGALAKKQNVFDDFTAAARLLIDDRTTSPAHLAIMGGSNGGLLMGAELTQHPAMFRAVASLVGIYDMMRIELDPNGQFNTTEFGTVNDPLLFRAMLAYSPYHHVQKDVAYPAIFMATGTHDGRVNPMHSRKMIAALQAATSSGRPVLLSISDKAGHGIGSALDVRIAQRSDVLAFLFDQLGMTLPGDAK